MSWGGSVPPDPPQNLVRRPLWVQSARHALGTLSKGAAPGFGLSCRQIQASCLDPAAKPELELCTPLEMGWVGGQSCTQQNASACQELALSHLATE